MGVDRRVNTQDVSWFLDLYRYKQINLNPPYQRRSVWNKKDRQYFLDTIFNNYPCPAFYIQKDSTSVRSQYDVVDGKQRLQTIFDFYDNKLDLSDDIADDFLKNKKWRDIEENEAYRRKFLDYVVTVEQLNSITNDQWNSVFYRLNKNAKTLTAQELRHATFDGWFINTAEKEVQDPIWEKLKISTVSKARRMKDVEYVSILLLVILERKIVGYPQTSLDSLYEKYDNPKTQEENPIDEEAFFQSQDAFENSNSVVDASEINKIDEHIGMIEDEYCDLDFFYEDLRRIKDYISTMLFSSSFLETNKVFGRKRTNNLFSLWTYLALTDISDIPSDPAKLNSILEEFFILYEHLESREIGTGDSVDDLKEKSVAEYIRCNSGASTEASNREIRLSCLQEFVRLCQE